MNRYGRLDNLEQKTKYNVLFVGCHPDDVELGCGGTILKHTERGDNVSVIVMTNGDKGGHNPERKEIINSMKVLGVNDIRYGNFKDGYLKDDQEVVQCIESIINELHINRVYTHDANDRHQDHRNCSKAVSAAGRKISEVLLYEGPSTNQPFEPHYFIELSDDHMQKKLKSLKCYKSQIEKGIVNLHWVKSLAGAHGGYHRIKYAEAFALNHSLHGGKDV